jgi:hypothetical protein
MTEMANETRAFDVRNEIVRHGFVIRLPDAAKRHGNDWAAFGLDLSENVFPFIGFYATPREAYAAVIEAEDERLVEKHRDDERGWTYLSGAPSAEPKRR